MAEIQLRQLRVSAEMDASSYVAGARDVAGASRDAGQAVTGLGATVTKSDQVISRSVGSLERLKRTYIDGYAASAKMESALNGISRGLERGAISAQEAALAADGVIRRLGIMGSSSDIAARGQIELAQAIDAANSRLSQQISLSQRAETAGSRVPVNDNLTGARDDRFRRQNLGYQLFDIGQSASLGMPLAMIAAQQGPQIAQLYAAQGGLNAAMKDFGVILGTVARVAGPFIAILAAMYGGYKILEANSAAAKLAVDETTKALAAQAAPISSLDGKIRELAEVQTRYNEALFATATAQDAASKAIVASSQREFDAKKALLEIELKRQEAAVAVQESELAIAALQLKKEAASKLSFNAGLAEQKGFADPRINGGIPFVRTTDDISGLDKTHEVMAEISKSPAAERVRELQANVTLTSIAVDKLREGVKQLFSVTGDKPVFDVEAYDAAMRRKQQAYQDMYNPVPNFPNGVPIPEQRPLDGGDESAVEKQLSLLRQQAGARSDIVSQIQAQQQLFQGQNDELEKLRLEATLVGASVEQRARATAALQAEQELRQRGINLLSQEGQMYVANAQAMAAARAEIERQNAAYSSLQSAGGSAIDSLTVGTGSLRDRLKAAADTMLQWIQQLTIANPLKNALFGSNLPTMGDLFSGRPAIPGATTTGSMMVTAGTVMVNGGVMGGQFPAVPGLTSTATTPGTLSSVLGISNGVRPSLTPGGIVNSPVAANDIASRAMMWRQGISQIESGSYAGNYNAIGPVTRSGDQAYGRYQVMGANIPSWSEKYYGQRLTPSQYLANPAAQDAVFDGEFGSYVSKYGEGPAANKWFTGSHIARGATDVNGMSDNRYSAQFTSNMQKLSSTTATASKDIGTLGDTSTKVGTQITDGLGKLTTPAVTTQVPVTTPTAPAGGNIFSSFFGGFFKLLGFADGTDFAPGGLAMVGERGRELVNLPRGSQVIPNHKMPRNSEERMRGTVRFEYNINVGGNGDKELLERMRMTAEESVRNGIATYDQVLPDRIDAYRRNPEFRGAV